MAKKHFDAYVKRLESQLEEYKRITEELSKEAQEGMTDINFVENFQQQVAPFTENYKRVLYIKFLLDQPNKKEKISKHRKALKKQLEKLGRENSPEAVLEENNNILKSIGGNHE